MEKYEIIYKDESGIVQSTTVTFEVRNSYLWPILGCVAAVVVISGTVVFLILRKKKSKKS